MMRCRPDRWGSGGFATGGSVATMSAPAVTQLLSAWALPLGWLICRCDDLASGQRALLAALEAAAAAHSAVLHALAPTLKAWWEAEVLSEQELLVWASATADGVAARRARRFAAPLLEWLRTAEVAAEPAPGVPSETPPPPHEPEAVEVA
mmetsp:Transcript_2703/g.5720  ORF Transcript_2703/g.5720 Transcript_2703/m.5720 type:complete len:150 (-) Transcript_2703:545-994(-)